MKWKSIKRLLTGGRSISRIEEELEMIELNDVDGQVLSSGLRAHRVGPKHSFSEVNVLTTDIPEISPGKASENAFITYVSTEKIPISYV